MRRVNTLIGDIARNGNEEGIGKPEPLKHGFRGYPLFARPHPTYGRLQRPGPGGYPHEHHPSHREAAMLELDPDSRMPADAHADRMAIALRAFAEETRHTVRDAVGEARERLQVLDCAVQFRVLVRMADDDSRGGPSGDGAHLITGWTDRRVHQGSAARPTGVMG